MKYLDKSFSIGYSNSKEYQDNHEAIFRKKEIPIGKISRVTQEEKNPEIVSILCRMGVIKENGNDSVCSRPM